RRPGDHRAHRRRTRRPTTRAAGRRSLTAAADTPAAVAPGTVGGMARMGGIAAKAERLTGLGVISTTPVAGGDICTSTRLRLTDGRSAVMKTRPHAPENFFAREAEGLRWLQAAGGAAFPDVLAQSADCVLVSWVEPTRP